MIDLIILDLYGTIAIATSYDNTPRNGFLDFLEKNKNRKIALATNDPVREAIERILTAQSIADKFDRIYTGKDLVKIKGSYYREEGKNLKKICADFEVAPDRAVFISDGKADSWDAKRDGVKFIHVPKYERTDEAFSFRMIDLSKKLPKYKDLRKVNKRRNVY